MKKAVVLLIMSFFLLGVCEAGEAGVEGILERARERYLKFREVATDITMVKTITVMGEEKTIKIYKKGEMFRVERVDPEGILTISIYDGENFWLVIPERGIRERFQEGRKGLLLDDWFNHFDGVELKLDRIERLGGRDCYVLASRKNFSLWIDRESLALIKFEGKRYGERGEKEKITTTFSNFRVIEGWEIPLASRASKGGKVASFELSLDVETVLPVELFCAESIEIGAPPLPPWLAPDYE